ncbi:MAG: hypothetical protein QOG64_1491 [Acidimicrobiaceae bacterium]|nr:hypothetical protein [Acidimicrobiaceae bacterium]
MADITMPQLGETVTEGTITRWLKQVGDQVAEDEVLFEVSTDKVDSEVPSPAAGYLAEILVQEGETVDVGAKLAVISADAPSGNGSASAEAAAPAADGPEAEAASESGAPADGDAAMAETEAEQAGTPETEVQPAAAQSDGQTGEQPEPVEPVEPEPAPPPRPTASTRPPDSRPAGRPSEGGGGSSKVLSPVVRRLIAEHDLNADEINGTGAGGRITRSDVLALVDSGAMGKQASGDPVTAPADQASGPPAAAAKAGAKQPTSPAPAAPPAKAPAAAPAVKPGERDEVIPFTRIRRATAEHMIRSKATSAHTLIVIDVDYLGVEKVRAANKEQFRAEEGTGLNYLPFVSRAVIDAIREFPKVNASVGDDQLIVHHYVNLGIAVDLNLEGLLVPVIRDADSKRLRAIAREIADLAGRARSKKLSVDELAGGTFTITNPGPFGTLITGPVINQPQIAILSTDGVKKRPVAIELPDGTDGIAVHPTGNLAIQFDHRAIDGAYASAFLAKVKEILETRDWSQEL